MGNYPQLNYPQCKLRAKQNGSNIKIWDTYRKQWLVLTPEEWVRQHILNWLTIHMNIDTTRIVCEYPVNINKLDQRADIVVVDKNLSPVIIIECKAAHIKITEDTFEQVARYNTEVKAKYAIISNGIKTLCFQYDTANKGYIQIDNINEILENLFN